MENAIEQRQKKHFWQGRGGGWGYALTPPPPPSQIQNYDSKESDFSNFFIKNTMVGRLLLFLSNIA